MKVTVSSKYQVVIPKKVRKELNIQPGQTLDVSADTDGTVIIKKESESEIDRLIDKYAGIAKGAWGDDPVKTIRQMRDEEWD